MSKMTSDFFVERLKAWGVTRIYGYPGDGINGVLGALQRAGKAGDGIEFIQVRHEEMAAFMATAHAKFTGELGVCLSTGGPGATHLVTGLYDAKSDHVPVLAIAGQAETTVRGASYQQELNLDRMFADVADFVQEAAAPAQLRHLVDRGLRIATARDSVTVLILPKDVQDMPWEEPARAHGFTRSGPGYAKPRVVPHDADLRRGADILNAGEKVAILIGAGARDAADDVEAVADRLGAGVAKALLGKDVLPDDLPYVTGSIGLLGTKPSSDMMDGCDTLLMIGTGFPWAEFLPADGRVKAVQIDIAAEMLGLRYPVDVNLHGDAAETLRALLPLLDRKDDRSWQDGIVGQMDEWRETLKGRALAAAETDVNPQRVVYEMSPRLPADAIVTSDSGSCANWYARDWQVKRGQRGSLSGGLASMGAAVPYAIAAKFAYATDEQAEATLNAAWDAGVRYFDVSPWYGLGLAERRFGRFLSRKPRNEFVISSKVGKLLKASRDNDAKTYFPFTTSPNTPRFDYTADGVHRSIEDSLQRLGLDRIDIVFVHDLSPDNQFLPEDWEMLWPVAEKGAFRALTQLRDEGTIDGWGMGVNCPQPILRCLETADTDVHLLASQYSLIDHDNAIEQVFPRGREAGVSFVMGSSLNAGFLGGAGRYNYGEENTVIPADKREKMAKLRVIAGRHGVDLVAASLQFSLAPDVASALIVGTAKPDHILADHAALRARIAPGFWQDLRSEGLIHPDAPLPSSADA